MSPTIETNWRKVSNNNSYTETVNSDEENRRNLDVKFRGNANTDTITTSDTASPQVTTSENGIINLSATMPQVGSSTYYARLFLTTSSGDFSNQNTSPITYSILEFPDSTVSDRTRYKEHDTESTTTESSTSAVGDYSGQTVNATVYIYAESNFPIDSKLYLRVEADADGAQPDTYSQSVESAVSGDGTADLAWDNWSATYTLDPSIINTYQETEAFAGSSSLSTTRLANPSDSISISSEPRASVDTNVPSDSSNTFQVLFTNKLFDNDSFNEDGSHTFSGDYETNDVEVNWKQETGIPVETEPVSGARNYGENTRYTEDPQISDSGTGASAGVTGTLEGGETSTWQSYPYYANGGSGDIPFDVSVSGLGTVDVKFRYDYDEPAPTPVDITKAHVNSTTYSLPLADPADSSLEYGSLRVYVNNQVLAADLVNTSDPDASPVRIYTPVNGTLSWRKDIS